MVKPINMGELILRISALLRRAGIVADHELTVVNLALDSDAMTAVVDGEEIPETVREFNYPACLDTFSTHPIPNCRSFVEHK